MTYDTNTSTIWARPPISSNVVFLLQKYGEVFVTFVIFYCFIMV